MMSINDELYKAKINLRSTRKAILGRGGEISENAGLQEVANAVYKIPADTSLVYQTDEGVAYEKIVPPNAEEYAQIERIGGMSYKSENLLPFPYTQMSHSENGGNFVALADGGIQASGTPTAPVMMTLYNGSASIFPRVFTYSLQGDSANTELNISIKDSAGVQLHYAYVASGKSATIDMSSYPTAENIQFNMNKYSNNIAMSGTAYPMLNEGSTAKPYSQYFKGLRDTKVEELVSEGANLFDISKVVTNSIVANNGDHLVITAEATSSGGSAGGQNKLKRYCPELKVGETYTINANTTATRKYVYLSGNAKQTWEFGKSKTITQEMLDATVVWYASGNGETATVSEIMINHGTTPAPYKPFHEGAIDTRYISEEIRLLDGYGRGIEGCVNYIDLNRKVFVPNVGCVDMGTLNWVAESASFSAMLPDIKPTANGDYQARKTGFLCDKYKPSSVVDYSRLDDMSMIRREIPKIHVRDSAYTDVAEFQAAMSGVMLIYELATPVEIDISEHLPDDNFLKVEGGGVIRAVNEYKYDAPTTINYLTKTEG